MSAKWSGEWMRSSTRPLLSRAELDAYTTLFERRAAEKASYDELINLLVKMHTRAEYTALAPRHLVGTPFWRARKVSNRPYLLSQISYPPEAFVKMKGRLNAEGESLLYCAINGPGTSILECAPNVGDVFVVGLWKNTEKILVNQLGFCDTLVASVKGRRRLQEFHSPSFYNFGTAYLSEWQSRVFTRRVLDGDEDTYLPSIALARFALSYKEFMGVQYPSIAGKYLGDNVAFRTSTVDSSLSFKRLGSSA